MRQELLETFERVAKLLEESIKELPKAHKSQQQQQEGEGAPKAMPPASHTLMDLVITLSIYLPRSTYSSLFNLAAQIFPLKSHPQLQKKAYKLIPRLANSTLGAMALREQNVELQKLLIDTASSVSAPARKDRLSAVAVAVEHLSDTDLHFIPILLSEAVLACKETNAKTRTTAFDLLILMARRMSRGGIVEQAKIPHMDAGASTTEASLEEFFTMVGAGLAGNTPHMISASVTALTRILYEFIGQLSKTVVEDLVQTMSVFLTSKNREIVRSVLGFVKVSIISLPEDIIKPRLESIIQGLISWGHEHKAKFKQKVKHILERAIRRFGYESIERLVPEEDKKFLHYIRKDRDRRKKKKKNAEANEDGVSTGGKKVRFESEFDEALYGSDSSASSISSGSDADEAAPRSRRKGATNGAYITEN